MNFIQRLISKFSKPIQLEEMIVEEDQETKKETVHGLKKGSSALVEIEVIAEGFLPLGKRMVSEDVAIILITTKKARLCQ